MPNKPARFRQAELARAIRAARDTGALIAIVDGSILINPQPDPTKISPLFSNPTIPEGEKVAKAEEIDL